MGTFQKRYIAAAIICISAFYHYVKAENICDETPPANRAVDEIPAYSQCDSSTGDIYSNNGIDTRATSGGNGWVRTQRGGGYQCTEFAHRYLTFRWNIQSVPSGNAGTWGDNSLPAGLVKATTPVHGDIIVFGPGSCGASSTTGHVAIIDSVNGSTLTIVEQNVASRRKCQTSCAKYFLHAETNTPSVSMGKPDHINGNDGLSVQYARDMISIQLNGDFTTGSSVCLYDLKGQKIADLTNQIFNGRTSLEPPTETLTMLLVRVRKGSRTICKTVLLR